MSKKEISDLQIMNYIEIQEYDKTNKLSHSRIDN